MTAEAEAAVEDLRRIAAGYATEPIFGRSTWDNGSVPAAQVRTPHGTADREGIDMEKPTASTEPAAVHEWQMEYESREVPSDSPWVEREPTGLAWGRCSCGFTVEGPEGKPLPRAEVEARMQEHL